MGRSGTAKWPFCGQDEELGLGENRCLRSFSVLMPYLHRWLACMATDIFESTDEPEVPHDEKPVSEISTTMVCEL